MNRVLSFSIFVAAATLVGCGGGGSNGGGGKGRGILALSFVADAGSGLGPVGTSHRIVVYRNDGTIIDTKTVDTSSGTATISLSNLPSGTLRLHVGLSQTTDGPEVGAVDTTFQGGVAAAPMTFAMRRPADSVTVTPATGTVSVGSTLPLYAAAKDADGAYVYRAASDWNWSSSNDGFATVNAAGVATGQAEGAATITAGLAGTSLTGTSNLGVLANGVRQGKWTVMVYLNAANSLYGEALGNINQMERIANNPNVRFVVQWKQTAETGQAFNQDWSGTRRYLVNYDTKSAVASTVVQDMGAGVDMGSPSALANFVAWTKTKYPADHYALVVWNHGAGWNSPRSRKLPSRGVSYDDETNNFLDLPEVASALGAGQLDVLAYDACLMQGAEDLMELSTTAKYIVASEENTPAPGFPYDRVFAPAVANADIDARALAAAMPAAFTNFYATTTSLGDYRGWPLHLSAIDTSKVADFRNALDNFSLALTDPTANVGTLMTNVRAASTRMDTSQTFYAYYDVDQIAEKTASLASNGGVVSTANALRTAVSNLVVANSTSPSGTHMRGLSIEFGRSSKYATYADDYANLQISLLTHWDDFLASTANP